MKNILIPFANGNEDIELISIVDILTRAKNAGAKLNLICAALNDNLEIKLDSGLVIKAHTTLDKVDLLNLDAIVLAGGFDGMNNLKNDDRIIKIIQKLNVEKKLIAAICASPIVLNKAGVIKGDFTCYPGCESSINASYKSDKFVVVNENIITGIGPIASSFFALTILKELGFKEAYEGIKEGLLINHFDIKF